MDFDTTAADLHAAIAKVAPIHGVSIGRKDDKTTWRISYIPEATVEQQDAALTMLLAFDLAANDAARVVKREREQAIQAKMRELAERMVDEPTLLDTMTRTR